MSYRSGWVFKGIGYLLRGMASGRKVHILMGGAMILVRLVGARRKTKIAQFVLKKGRSTALRVTAPGADPVTFRVDRPG